MPRVDGETSPDIEVNCTMRSRHSASSSTSRLFTASLFPATVAMAQRLRLLWYI